MIQDKEKPDHDKKENEEAAIKPDEETLGTTDPQEHMEGPISSLVQKTRKTIEENDKEDGTEDKDA